jgi:hypothetical protein
MVYPARLITLPIVWQSVGPVIPPLAIGDYGKIPGGARKIRLVELDSEHGRGFPLYLIACVLAVGAMESAAPENSSLQASD